MPRWHTWICDYNPAEYERVPKGYISHQLDPLARGGTGVPAALLASINPSRPKIQGLNPRAADG
jgi:hypothetical protein